MEVDEVRYEDDCARGGGKVEEKMRSKAELNWDEPSWVKWPGIHFEEEEKEDEQQVWMPKAIWLLICFYP